MSQDKKPRRVGARQAKYKEAFYIRIPVPGDVSKFIPATEFIGRKMPVARALETCAMRVYPDVACFSVLHLTKARSAAIKNDILEMPHGPLARLARRAQVFGPHLQGDMVIVEHGSNIAAMTIVRDATGVLSLESAEMPDMESLHHTNTVDDKGNLGVITGADGEMLPAFNATDANALFERDRRGERISVFFRSPVIDRVVAVGFLGHLPGKPGGNDNLNRATSMVLKAVIALAEFSYLATAKAVHIPSLPGGGFSAAPPSLQSAQYQLPVDLLTEVDFQPVASGSVTITVDLSHIGNTGSGLLCSISPDNALGEHWEAYTQVADEWLDTKLPDVLGDELELVVNDILMGMVDDATVIRLRGCLDRLPRVRFTPTLSDEVERTPSS